MERQVTFSTTLVGGFDKKTVLKYIDELCAQNKVNEEEQNKQNAALLASNEALQSKATQLEEQVQALAGEAISSGQKELDMQTMLQKLHQTNTQLQGTLTEKERELRGQQEKCRQLTLRAETLEYKGKRYDESLAQIGNAFLEAQENAQEIMKTAVQRASYLTTTTLENIQSLAEQLNSFKGDVNMLRGTLQASMADLEDRLDGLDTSIDTLGVVVKKAGAGARCAHEEELQQEIEQLSGEKCCAVPPPVEEPQPQEPPCEENRQEPAEQAKPANSQFFW